MKTAVLVLANGLKSTTELSESTLLRCQKALEVYEPEERMILSTGYTINKAPKTNEQGYPVSEATVMARYVAQQGVAPEKILTETHSKDTIGNLYFSRLMHLDPLGIEKVKVVTSAFHMPRVRLITHWLLSDLVPEAQRPQLTYYEAPNAQAHEQALHQIMAKEKAACENIERLKRKIKSQSDFHNWLFQNHIGYCYDFDPEPLQGTMKRFY